MIEYYYQLKEIGKGEYLMAGEKEGVEVRFRLPKEAYERLEEIATARNWSVETLLRKAFSTFVFAHNIVYEDPERALLIRKGEGLDDIERLLAL